MGTTFAGALFLVIAAFGGKTSAAEETMDLSLNQAIDTALQKHLRVRMARLGKQVQSAAVSEESARFGQTVEIGLSHASDRSPSISRLENVPTSTSSSQALSLGVARQLSTGGRIGLTISQNRASSNAAFRIIDPVYGSDLEVEFAQPLFRGAGKINRAPLSIARNGLEQAEIDLDQQTRDLIADVRLAYWDLFFVREDLKVRQQLSEGGRRVLETVRARVETGLEPENSILEAQVGVARREEDIVIAEDLVRDAEDRLKALMGLDQDPQAWTLRLVPIEAPTLVPFDDDLDQGIQRASRLNPAFRRKEIDLKTADLQAAIARDNTRPSVALTFRAGLKGIGGSYTDNLSVLRDGDGRSWQGGFSIDTPLGRTPDGERHRRRLLEKEQMELDLERLRLEIVQQVRERSRQVKTDTRRVEVAALAEGLADRNVQEEEQRMNLGLSTVRQVLDAQDEQAEARAKRLRALVDYNNALIEWERLTRE